MLDSIVNSILGRNSGLPGVQHDTRLKEVGQSCHEQNSGREISLQATFDLCPFLDELERKESHQDTSSTESLLQRLQQWSKALPPQLRSSTDISSPGTVPADRELYVGGMHVACIYYFSVILATRRFFTRLNLDRIQEHARYGTAPSTSKLDDSAISLAHVCTSAAISLARVGYNAMITQQMLNNMCLLQ